MFFFAQIVLGGIKFSCRQIEIVYNPCAEPCRNMLLFIASVKMWLGSKVTFHRQKTKSYWILSGLRMVNNMLALHV